MSRVKKRTKESEDKSQRIKSVIGIILCVILIPILVMNCVLIARFYLNPGTIPGIGGKFPLIVMSDSMYPVFQTGDLLICHSVDTADLEKGDIIIYYVRDEDIESETGFIVVAHRITKIKEKDGKRIFTTMGDANASEDPSKVPEEDVIGIYQTHIKGLRRVAMFMQTTPGLIVCVVLPAALLIGIDLLRRRRYEKHAEADTAELMAELEELRAQKDAAGSGVQRLEEHEAALADALPVHKQSSPENERPAATVPSPATAQEQIDELRRKLEQLESTQAAGKDKAPKH